jgi:SAM-dependent methyltransferase
VLGPPLKPSSEDVQFVENEVENWSSSHPGKRVRALLLGVTAGIANMRWPEESSLIAVDNSFEMARTVWPGNIPSKRRAVCGDWLSLPQAHGSCDVVIGDGSMNCVRYPDGFRALAKSVCGVLRPDGVLLLRSFVRPERKDSLEQVFADLFRCRFPTVNHFKFQLLMAMQRSTEQGIVLDDVYREWVRRKINKDELIALTGWEKQSIRSIEIYEGQDVVHTFPTVSELRSVISEFFDEVSIATPGYLLGDRCPSFVLTPRSGEWH